MSTFSAKEKLRELQDEINEGLKEETKLTEHDLDILQKKYELKMAEIAMNDAE
jgi:S-adenosylhomocysteine hydrolase